jgi:hypothetical protein
MGALGGSNLTSSLKDWIQELLRSAHIVSPRFDDYRIETLDWYGEPGIDIQDVIESEVEKILEASGVKPNRGAKAPKDQATDNILDVIFSAGMRGAGGSGAVLNMIKPLLGPAAVAFLAPIVTKMVLEELIRPGGALDIRYKRQITNEVENYLSRQIQRDTQIGNRQVIVQMRSQFLNLHGEGNSNTYQQVRDLGTRFAETGLRTKDSAQLLERLIGR